MLLLAGGMEVRGSGSGPAVVLHLDQWHDGSWHAAVEPGNASPPHPAGGIGYPHGYIVTLPERGSFNADDLGFYRRVHRWELMHVRIGVISNHMTGARLDPEQLPAEAVRALITTLERDVFDETVQRDQISAAMLDDPAFDPLFTSWEKRTSSWSALMFARTVRRAAVIAVVSASIIAAFRFAVPCLIRRREPGRCASCEYDLTGLPPGEGTGGVTCPECGRASTPVETG